MAILIVVNKYKLCDTARMIRYKNGEKNKGNEIFSMTLKNNSTVIDATQIYSRQENISN